MSEQTELILGLVGAVGTDLKRVADELRTELHEYGYGATAVRVSDYLQDLPWTDSFADRPEDERTWLAMDAGTRLRVETERGDALALWAISDIVTTRIDESTETVEDGHETYPANLDRRAWILRSLKTPAEVASLRAVYGPRFVLFAAYSPDDQRLEDLRDLIRLSRGTNDESEWLYQPADLIARDRKENLTGGQDVEGTFHQADFFVDASDAKALREDVVRSLEILFGHPFRTPTRDEFAQFMASGAALRSAELGRQVGAAIVTTDGSIVSLGTNEVPKAGGGAHWEEDGAGNREFEVAEVDTNRREQDKIASEIAERLRRRLRDSWPARAVEEISELEEHFGAGLEEELMRSRLQELTEFGRAVHAEMDALLDAVRRGVAVRACTLHTTTFPCHTCARHIIGAGVDRVVFVEPYSKSRALELHAQDLVIGRSTSETAAGTGAHRVRFEPFRGTAPRRYLELFDLRARERVGRHRKASNGTIESSFDKRRAVPVFSDLEPEPFRPTLPAYRRRELLALASFEELSEQLTHSGDQNPCSGPGGLVADDVLSDADDMTGTLGTDKEHES